jgi:hypothetical protein
VEVYEREGELATLTWTCTLMLLGSLGPLTSSPKSLQIKLAPMWEETGSVR